MNDFPIPIREILLVKRHRRPAGSLLASAVDLARHCDARLTFAQVLEGGDRIDDASRRETLSELEALISPYLQGLEVDYRLISGDLAAAAEEADGRYQLIFPADSGAGSEAAQRELARLFRSSPLPIWLERGSGRAPRGILAAVDLQTPNPLKRALNRPILRHAVGLAAALDARLDVLTVRTTPVTSERLALRLAGVARPGTANRRELRAQLEELVSDIRRDLPTLKVEPRLLVAQGDPDELIARAAESAPVDLLVAGCLGRAGLAAWLLGDTAERLSQRLDCSILAVKPTKQQLEATSSRRQTRAA